MSRLRSDWWQVQLVRVKNRMDADTNQHKLYAGYRDVALNLRFR